MEDVLFEYDPPVESPVLIAAYRGWNDAADAASHAVDHLVSGFGARRFASIDPDEYYDFTQIRPHTRSLGQYRRELSWPRNEFYHSPELAGVILFLGTEPHLRWKRFGRNLVAAVQRLGVREVISLGALLADTPHTLPVPLSGGGSTPEMGRRLERLDIQPSSYEGPTGILSVTGVMLSEVGIANGSIWAAVPHYISVSPNPSAALALVSKVAGVIRMDVPLDRLRAEATEYEARVREAIEGNPEVQQYVRDLELSSLTTPAEPELDRPPDDADDASLDDVQAEGLIESVEEFLRQRQAEQHTEDDSP